MPHIIVEYTKNIKVVANIPALLQKINETLIAEGDVFPIGGLRARAIELADYYIADGTADDAFVHVTLKIGAGRSEAVKKSAGDQLFKMIEAHFSLLFEERFLALSMEIYEFEASSTYKKNNIHHRYKM